MNSLSYFHHAAAALSLFALMSCGADGDSKSSKRQAQNDCETLSCLSSVNWKVFLQGRSFPSKSRVEINDQIVLDECLTKNQFEIDRTGEPQSLTLTSYQVPTDEVKISISDLGSCEREAETSFLSQENVPFDLVKSGEGVFEVLINL